MTGGMALQTAWLWNAHKRPGEGKLWLEYEGDAAEKLEGEFQRRLEGGRAADDGFCMTVMGTAYRYKFDTMEQVNMETGFVRQMCRVRVPKGRDKVKLVRMFPSGYLERVVFSCVATVNWREITKQKRVYAAEGDYKEDAEDAVLKEPLGSGDDDENPVVKLGCGCVFFERCIEKALMTNPKCPNCAQVYLAPGSQPSGVMEIREKNFSCEGAEGRATVEIRYTFDGGTQNERMPRPGEAYSGTSRLVFVPSDENGAATVALLKKAFQNGYAFMVGDSVTTGKTNTVVWRVHQKTSTSGGAARYGWPDAEYLDRLRSECVNYGLVSLDASN